MSVVYFLVLVGALVIIHELGHFLAARALDFRVLRFSIGFGRPLLRLRGRETEYQLGLVPLGGYVRLLGEDPGDDIPPADAHRAWSARPVWARTIVVLAGPAANLVLPVVLYFAAFAGHRELPAAVVGDVLRDSPAARAGLEAGDRVLSIDGEPMRYWEDVEARVEASPGRTLTLRVERRGKPVDVPLVPEADAGGRRGQVGIVAAPFLPQVGVIDPGSPAARAGLVTGDLVTAVDGAPVASWAELERALGGARRLSITYLRGQRTDALGVEVFEPHHASLVPETVVGADGKRAAVHGLHPASTVLAEVEPGSPAAHAGLKRGDRVTSIDGAPVDHWIPLARGLAAAGTTPVTIGVLRAVAGRVLEDHVVVHQRWRTRVDDYGQKSEELEFGARSSFVAGRAERVAIDGRFLYAAGKSVERTLETVSVVATGMGSILRGKSPEDELGGPITMFRVAAVSGSKGFETFLLMLALVSVSVGLINLLPVPILDGGHLLLFAIEAVRREPLSPRWRDRVTWVGLAVVGLITMLAIGNDVMRYVL